MSRVEGRRAGGTPGTAAKVPERQGHRRLAYLVLGAALLLAAQGASGTRGGAWGMSTLELAVWSWILAGIFQFGVAPVWRIELHGGLIRKRFGWAGFRRFGLAFPVVRVSRMLLIVPISLSDAGTPPVHPAVAWILVLGPMPPIPWLAHSIRKCLPFQCAIGADHFVRGARGSPVTRGIFKYIGNPMHAVILPAPCQPGLL